MKKHKLFSLVLVFALIATITSKAGNIAPLWSKETKAAIIWQKVTPMGQLIACTANGLHCFDGTSGNEIWTIAELKNVQESTFEPINNSPFISVGSGSNLYIINPFEGKIVFSSKDAGIQQVNDKYFLYKNNKIIIIGQTSGSKNVEFVMVDMNTGKKLWSKSGGFSMLTGVKDLDNDEVLITSAFYAMKIKASSGEEIWKKAIDPKTANLTMLFSMLEGFAAKMLTKDDLNAQLIIPQSRPDIFLIAAQKKIQSTSTDSKGKSTTTVSYHSVYMAFDLNSGEHKWKTIVELQNPLGVSFAAEEGLIVCASNNGDINMLSYNDGSALLGKKGRGLSLKGPATSMAPLSNGKILIVSERGSNSSITMLDPSSGNFTFEKAAKLKGAVSYTEILSGGILIGSEEEVNLLNATTGDWYFEKAMQGGAGLIASNNDKVFIFNTKDNLLYQMEIGGTSIKPLSSTPLKFGGKEDPKYIEIMDKGVIVKSDQNIALIDFSGSVKYNHYFPAPGVSGFRKALLIASAVRATFYTVAFTATSMAMGATSQAIHVKDANSKIAKGATAGASVMFGEASLSGASYISGYMKQANQRFKATSETPNYMLIMSTPEGSKTVKLLQVSKANGELLNAIELGQDKTPIYDVDMVEGRLYYMKSATKMEGYQF